MNVVFAKHIGFCSGVKRAVAIAQESAKNDPKPIWFLGSLVHNEKVISEFKKKKVNFIENLSQATSGTLIIRAHGHSPIPPKIFKKVLVKDATCPLVKKAQLVAQSLFNKNYKIIIIGDKKHAETIGIKGWCKNKAIIVENESQAKKIKKEGKIGVVCQTTQKLENVERILEILKTKTENLKFENTLCPEVQQRQKEVNNIIKNSDTVLVIGSKKSANTTRLTEICKQNNKKFIWVNSLTELKKKTLKNIKILGVVSGTSAPDQEIEKIKEWLI